MITNSQFNIAFEILSTYYGVPTWEASPKEGQSKDEIIKVWCDELKEYTTDQVREACAWLTRKKKTMTFPTINVLMCELMGQQRHVSTDKNGEAENVYRNLSLNAPHISKLAVQRAVFRIYGVEVDGYKNAEDAGY